MKYETLLNEILNLKTFSNETLMDSFAEVVRTERKIMHAVLFHIVEIDRRQIYLARAYPSMFEFLTQKFGYSPAAAMRRIEGARLLRELPWIAPKIESGSLNLSQLSQAAQSFRQASKTQKITTETKAVILQGIESKTSKETEIILAQALNLEPQRHETKRHNPDGSLTLTITLTPEQAERFERLQGLAAHAVPSAKAADLIDYLVEKEITKRTVIQRASPTPKPNSNARRVVPKVRKHLMTQSCCYRDPITGKICGSNFFKQGDHIKSVSTGGTRDASNLQTLCAKHNLWKYRQSVCVSEVKSSVRIDLAKPSVTTFLI